MLAGQGLDIAWGGSAGTSWSRIAQPAAKADSSNVITRKSFCWWVSSWRLEQGCIVGTGSLVWCTQEYFFYTGLE